jgi:ribosome recycling factor
LKPFLIMQTDQITTKFKSKLEESLGHFQSELSKLRTGRAHASILDKIIVKAYGVTMPLKQVANVTAPEAQLIQVTPFDSGNLQAIASAIRDDQSLWLNPVDDGMVIRVQIPPLTTERRADIVKQVGQKVEDTMITMRNARHDAIKDAETAKKAKDITEDDYSYFEKNVDEIMSQYKSKIDVAAKSKEQEIMTV